MLGAKVDKGPGHWQRQGQTQEIRQRSGHVEICIQKIDSFSALVY